MRRLFIALMLSVPFYHAADLLIGHNAAVAADRCLKIVRNGNSERMVNTCDHCRVGSLLRSRPGSSMPVTRKYNVQAGTVFPVPFKGSGRTRITADRPCPGTEGASKDLLRDAAKPNADLKQQCVSMEQGADFGVRLFNECGECRAVAVERYMLSGVNGGRDYMMIAANTRQTVPSRGFDQIGLLGDIPCPTASR